LRCITANRWKVADPDVPVAAHSTYPHVLGELEEREPDGYVSDERDSRPTGLPPVRAPVLILDRAPRDVQRRTIVVVTESNAVTAIFKFDEERVKCTGCGLNRPLRHKRVQDISLSRPQVTILAGHSFIDVRAPRCD
jgi:hypothetical protein